MNSYNDGFDYSGVIPDRKEMVTLVSDIEPDKRIEENQDGVPIKTTQEIQDQNVVPVEETVFIKDYKKEMVDYVPKKGAYIVSGEYPNGVPLKNTQEIQDQNVVPVEETDFVKDQGKEMVTLVSDIEPDKRTEENQDGVPLENTQGIKNGNFTQNQGIISNQLVPTYGTNVFSQQYQGGMPAQFTPSNKTYEKIYTSIVTDTHKAQVDLNKEYIKHHLKMKEDERKAILAEKRDEANYRRKIYKENATQAIIENSHGFMCIEIQHPGGQLVISEPIFKYGNICLTKLIVQNNEELYVIHWMDGNQRQGFILKGKKRSAKYLLKGFDQKGNPVKFGRDRKRQVADLIYGYLLSHGEEYRMPEHYGWNKEDNQWIFVDEGDLYLERSDIKGCIL